MSETPSPPPSAAARAWPIALAFIILCAVGTLASRLYYHASLSDTIIATLITPLIWGGLAFLVLWGLFALFGKKRESPPS